jgi:predicted metalloprotease with PDZ domain
VRNPRLHPQPAYDRHLCRGSSDHSSPRHLKKLAAWLAIQACTVASAAETMQYVLTPQVDSGRLLVELTWTTHGRTQSALSVAQQYGTVEDVPALLKDVKFKGVTDVQPQGARWIFRHPADGAVTCNYEVAPGRRELTWDTTYSPVTGPKFFHGLGNTFLLVPQSGGGQPKEYDVTLRWKLPDGWKAACSWGTGALVGAQLTPFELRHSVYLAGQIVSRTEKHDGHEVTVAMLDRFGFKPEELAALAETISVAQCDFMAEPKCPPLLVTAVPIGEPVKAGDSRLAGTGLYQSFALFAAPQSTLNDAFEHLFAHELFHQWNGGVLKAKSPDKLLYWFIEGFTDYYALRLLYDSGHWKPDVYTKWLNRHLCEYQRNPAIHASNEDISQRYWKERDTVGEIPYQRGLLLGLRWHRLARDKGVKDGVDKLFKSLVERGRNSDFEVTNEAIRQAGVKALGDWFGPEFDRYVTEAQTIDVPQNALSPDFNGRIKPVYDYEPGFQQDRSFREGKVRGLVSGSAAEKAGLREGDELVGWGTHNNADEPTELQVRRDGKLKTIRFLPRGKHRDVLQFEPAGGR